jgi:hypothetical protein
LISEKLQGGTVTSSLSRGTCTVYKLDKVRLQTYLVALLYVLYTGPQLPDIVFKHMLLFKQLGEVTLGLLNTLFSLLFLLHKLAVQLALR